jgi:hypothetical protein
LRREKGKSAMLIAGRRGYMNSLGIPLIDDHSTPLELPPHLAPRDEPIVRCHPVRQGFVWDRLDIVVGDVTGDGFAGCREEVVGENQAMG